MKRLVKTFSLLCAALLLLTLLSTTAFAAENVPAFDGAKDGDLLYAEITAQYVNEASGKLEHISAIAGFDLVFKGTEAGLEFNTDIDDLQLFVNGEQVELQGFEAVERYEDENLWVHYNFAFTPVLTEHPATYMLTFEYKGQLWKSFTTEWHEDNTVSWVTEGTGLVTPEPAPAPSPDPTPPVVALIAKPTASSVLVNGEAVAFDAYNIGGNNYFKLRDLANVLNGSDKQFEVGWDAENNAINLTSGQAYTAVGGEMTGKGEGDKTPAPTAAKILLDGKEVSLTAYNIEGNNYFKLRDIGLSFDFGVSWDAANNTIIIDTSVGYTAE